MLPEQSNYKHTMPDYPLIMIVNLLLNLFSYFNYEVTFSIPYILFILVDNFISFRFDELFIEDSMLLSNQSNCITPKSEKV